MGEIMRTFLNINLENMKNNFLYLRKKSGKDIIAVVKSNAYGHGLIECSKLFSSLGATMLAVATFEEAISIRKNLIQTPILLFEPATELNILYSYRITLSISSIDYLEELSKSRIPFSIHLALETGFNRLGILEKDIDKAISIIKNSHLNLKGIYTHFADENKFDEQYQTFKRMLQKFKDFHSLIIHTSSSSFIEKSIPETNACRIGLYLYGISSKYSDLKPCLECFAPIYRIKPVNEKETVGYDQLGVCQSQGNVITIPLGYSDGWNSKRKTIAYQEDYLPQIGKTCMDHMMFFSREVLDPTKPLEIIGPHIKVIDLAKLYNISPHEILATLSPRLKRNYYRI